MIILIDKKEYAVGLSWFAISSTDELEQFQREMELTHGVLKMSKDSSVQSTVALCGPEYNGQVSLAGMLSFAYTNLILVMATEYKDDNGQPLFYLCAVKNHAVTVEGDMVGTREEIQSLFSQNYADVTTDVDPNTVNCFGVGVDDVSFPGVNIVESHHVLDPAGRYAAQATIKTLGKKELSKGSIALVAGLTLIMGYFIYDLFLKAPPPPPPPPPVAAAPAPPPPPPPDPYVVYMQTFTQTLSQEPRVSVLGPLVKSVEAIPLFYDGWAVKTITFDGGSPKSFAVTLDKQNYANVDQILAHHDVNIFSSLHLDLRGEHAVASMDFDPGTVEYIPTEVFPTLDKSGSPKYYQLIGDLQMRNITYTATEIGKNNFFAQTDMVLTGDGLWTMVALQQVLAAYDTFGLKSVVITIQDGKYNWTIEGVIYG